MTRKKPPQASPVSIHPQGSLFDAAIEVTDYIACLGFESVIIGGLAVSWWAEPRYTHDVDFTVFVPLGSETAFARAMHDRFASRVADPMDFVLKSRLVLMVASNGVTVDVSCALPVLYETEVLRRSIIVEAVPGKRLRLIGKEDLVIHKCIAGRPQDIRDIEGVLIRQAGYFDENYTREILAVMAELLPEVDCVTIFESALAKANRAAGKRKAAGKRAAPKRKGKS